VYARTRRTTEEETRTQAGELDDVSLNFENQKMECTAQLTRKALKEDFVECDSRMVSCGLGCGFDIPYIWLDDYKKNHCCNRVVLDCPTEGCGQVKQTDANMKEHLQDLGNRVVVCPNACGVQPILVCELDEHRLNDCPLEKVDCPFKGSLGCDERIERGKLMEHTKSIEGLQMHLHKATVQVSVGTNEMNALRVEISSLSQHGYTPYFVVSSIPQ